ncbi:MAG: GTP cyclohydrolase I, partial [Hyphomicrobiaceae bacterium]
SINMTQSRPSPHPASNHVSRPTRADAEAAVRTLIAWTGEDPNRPGLRQTPTRVVQAYQEYFKGYLEDPDHWLATEDDDLSRGYDDMVMLSGIRVQSFCEHHMTPFEGRASVAYLPDRLYVGLSRLARVVDTFARRLQTQEALTHQVAETIERNLRPRGVAILIEAEHHCISFRGIRQSGITTTTTRFLGQFEGDDNIRQRFLMLCDRS